MASDDDDIDFDRLMRELPDARRARGAAVASPGRDPAGAGVAGGAGDSKSPMSTPPAPGAPREDRYQATAEERAAFLSAVAGVAVPKESGSRQPKEPVGTPDLDRLVRALRQGRVEPDASIDLHGLDRARALAAVSSFVAEARAEKWRVVRVVVGKGLHSSGGDAVVGPAVERWFREGPALEVVRAPAHLGGTGALLVVLRLE